LIYKINYIFKNFFSYNKRIKKFKILQILKIFNLKSFERNFFNKMNLNLKELPNFKIVLITILSTVFLFGSVMQFFPPQNKDEFIKENNKLYNSNFKKKFIKAIIPMLITIFLVFLMNYGIRYKASSSIMIITLTFISTFLFLDAILPLFPSQKDVFLKVYNLKLQDKIIRTMFIILLLIYLNYGFITFFNSSLTTIQTILLTFVSTVLFIMSINPFYSKITKNQIIEKYDWKFKKKIIIAILKIFLIICSMYLIYYDIQYNYSLLIMIILLTFYATIYFFYFLSMLFPLSEEKILKIYYNTDFEEKLTRVIQNIFLTICCFFLVIWMK
jgi:hypothetical protein